MKKKIIFTIMFLIIGASITYAADLILSSGIYFDNTNSNLKATNVQDAIEELYLKYEKDIDEPKYFSSDSWATIQKAVQDGNTDMYNVGDIKLVEIKEHSNGTNQVESQTAVVRISNKEGCTTETSESACGFVIEFAGIIENRVMNSTATNVGGWRNSEMREYLNSTIYESLPSDLQNVIVDTKVISGHGSTSGESNFETTDKLYLLAEKEIYGEILRDSLDTETKQLEYYKNNKTTMDSTTSSIKKINDVANYWWTRSPRSLDENAFMYINSSGKCSNFNANYRAIGISPAFRIA